MPERTGGVWGSTDARPTNSTGDLRREKTKALGKNDKSTRHNAGATLLVCGLRFRSLSSSVAEKGKKGKGDARE